MIDKRSESNISTNETKKAAVRSHIGSRTAACLLILHSFLASVFKSHQSARVLCCISEMSPLAWKNRFSEKSVFPNFSARKKACKDTKTPHFRAAFSVLHLSSTHFGAGYEARTRYLHLGKVALYQMS